MGEPDTRIEIWTDGSCWPNPGPGGWGAILKYRGVQREIAGAAQNTTNNRMELTAPIKALALLKSPSKVILHSDSQYVVKGITQWIRNWLNKGWAGVKNKDLWKELHALNQLHQVQWVWVRGHTGVELNERADELAAWASKHQSSYDKRAGRARGPEN